MRRWPVIALFLAALAVVAFTVDNPLWTQLVAWLFEQQRQFHRAMAGQLRGVAGGAAAWGLVGVSFLYGVFHAAGPGHGKAVIATYLATQDSHLGRGVALAVGASLCQGAVAVLLVLGLMVLPSWISIDNQQAVGWSERVCFALLALLGAVFALRASRRLLRRPSPAGHPPHLHSHGDDCGCCHGPSARQTVQAIDWRGTVVVLLAVGLRPCSGAVLVLALANVLGMMGAGVGAVFAMSAGTAMTVALLAVLTVKARHLAGALLARGGHKTAWDRGLGAVVAIAGGVIIAAMGLSLLAASFGPEHPLL